MRATSSVQPKRFPNGRWFRRGRTIIIDLEPGSIAQEQEIEGELPFARKVINPRIDVSAQRALIKMSNGSIADQLRSEDILVEVGLFILGIYQQDQRRPALLARSQGRNWWELLASGQNSGILCDPAASITRDPVNPKENAVFFFRKNLSQPLLIEELRKLSDQGLALTCLGSFPGPVPIRTA
jgi:hypothetical protein